MSKKFLQSLNDKRFEELIEIADHRKVTVQELIRAVIIPEWLDMPALSALPAASQRLTIAQMLSEHAKTRTRVTSG